jgi:hypothetical protein
VARPVDPVPDGQDDGDGVRFALIFRYGLCNKKVALVRFGCLWRGSFARLRRKLRGVLKFGEGNIHDISPRRARCAVRISAYALQSSSLFTFKDDFPAVALQLDHRS